MSEHFDILGHWSPLVYENPDNYHQQGLPPLVIGDRVPGYDSTIIQKLGTGGSCTVWLCFDGFRFGVVKTIKASHSFGTDVESEIKVINFLIRDPEMNDFARQVLVIPERAWQFESPNGTHVAHLLPVMGPSLEAAIIDPITRYALPAHLFYDDRRTKFAPRFAKTCIRDILAGLALIHDQGVVHTDFRIDQVLMEIQPNSIRTSEYHPSLTIKPIGRAPADSYPPQIYATRALTQGIGESPRCRITDFGASFIQSDDNSKLFVTCNWIFQSPELVYLHSKRYDPVYADLCRHILRTEIDVWALGLALHQILTHKGIFDRSYPHELNRRDTEQRLMLLWATRLGVVKDRDSCMGLGDMFNTIFNNRQVIREDFDWLKPITDTTPLDDSMMTDLPDWMDDQDKKEMIRIVKWCFTYDPKKRPSIKQLMADAWLAKWLHEVA